MKVLRRKNISYYLITVLVVLFFITRLVNLSLLPIFTDEAIYIRWSQIGSRDASWRFISLSDGKQPMFTWIMMVFLRIFPFDPLITGRLVSVLAGFVSMLGLGVLGGSMFGDINISLITMFLYIISPFTLIYDRLALYDSLVGTFYIWSIYFSIQLVRKLRLDTAFELAMVAGGGILNKSAGFFSLYLLPFIIILLDFKKKGLIVRMIRYFSLCLVAVLISLIYYSVLRLSPLYHMISLKNTVFVYSFSEWITHPFRFLSGNLRGLFDWQIGYLSLPVFIAAIIQIVLPKTGYKEKTVLFIYWMLPLLALALFARVLYPRFILFMTLPLLILSAVTLKEIIYRSGRYLFGTILIIVFIFPSLVTSYFIITNPKRAQIPLVDKAQFIDGWPSGWGIKEVNQYLTEASKTRKITVYTEGTFGLLPASIEIYQTDNKNVSVKGIWPLPKEIPGEMLDDAARTDCYLILNQSQQLPQGWSAELIFAVPKGNRTDLNLRLYRIITPYAYNILQ